MISMVKSARWWAREERRSREVDRHAVRIVVEVIGRIKSSVDVGGEVEGMRSECEVEVVRSSAREQRPRATSRLLFART